MAATVREIKKQNPTILVEVLTPDFGGDLKCVDTVIDSGFTFQQRIMRMRAREIMNETMIERRKWIKLRR